MIQIMAMSFKQERETRLKAPLSVASDEIILISSDEEMDTEEDDVIIISSDDDDAASSGDYQIQTICCDDESESHQHYPKVTSYSTELKMTKVKGETRRESDDDLPDIDLSELSLWEASRHEKPETLVHQLVNDHDNQPPGLSVNGLKRSYPKIKLEKCGDNSSDSEPPAKVSRFTDASVIVNCAYSNLIDAVRRDMVNSLLVGALEGTGRRHPCTMDCNLCPKSHMKEGKYTCTPVHIETLFVTMMEDYYLQNFACKALLSTLTSNNYLSPKLIKLLIQYLFGSDEKLEIAGYQEFQLGTAVLFKQLNLHPPCKPGFWHYYLTICLDWWKHLISKIMSVLQEGPLISSEGLVKEEPQTSVDTTSQEKFLDFSDVSRQKRTERQKLYKSLSKQNKLARLSVMLNFFADIMRNQAMVCSAKHWTNTVALLRSGTSPILAEVMWGEDRSNVGSVNKNIKQIFELYSLTYKEERIHKHVGQMIAVSAAIIQRQERCTYPEMGQLSRDFSRELYISLKQGGLKGNLNDLHPDWLRFHVAASFLEVEEPANFYKTKERISQILDDVDRGSRTDDGCDKKERTSQNLHDKDKGSHTDYGFDKETVCLVAIRAMMGMMTLKSSVPHCSAKALQLVSEDRDSCWFKDMLHENFISQQLESIKKTLSLPCVRGRTNFYFDGYENDFMKD